MDAIRKIILEEIKNVIKEEKATLRKKQLQKTLYEAVKTSSELKNKALNSKSIREAKKYKKKYLASKRLVKLAESKLSKHFRLNENHREGEGVMMKAQLRSIIDNANRIYHMIDESDMFEDWLQYKVTIAEDYLRAVNGYIKYFNGENHMEDGGINDDEFEYDDEDFDEWDDVDEEDAYDDDSDWDDDLDEDEDSEEDDDE